MATAEKEAKGTGTALATWTGIRQAANLPAETWNDARLEALWKIVAPEGATAADMVSLITLATRYDLDPFAKEIWLAKDRGRVLVLTGRDAFLKTARKHANYLGFRSGVVHENDVFEFFVDSDTDDVVVKHHIAGITSAQRGPIAGAYCIVYMRDRPPVWVIREFSDFKHLMGKDNWKNYPSDMVETRVLTAAHRRAVSISGVYAPEEFVDGELDPDVGEQERDNARAASATRSRLDSLRGRMTEQPARSQPAAPVGQEIEEAEYEVVGKPQPEPEPEPEPEKRAPPTPFDDGGMPV